MVLDKKETTVAYRCPECGSSVMSLIGIFSLSADMIRLKCPCGGSQLEVIYTKDKKIRLNVPCFLCPTPHSYVISSQMFFERDLFALPCGYSGLDICFIGRQDKVDAAMKESERELLEMIGDTDIDTLLHSVEHKDRPELSDPQVLDIIMFVIHDLADEGKIHCHCTDGGEYEAEVADDHMTIRCKKCGDSIDVPTNSLSAANDFLSCEELDLTKDTH